MKKTSLLIFLILMVQNTVATVFDVTSIADSGTGTLRQAIIDANANAGFDEIHFNLAEADCDATLITDTGVCRIILASGLPAITDRVLVNGTTQPQYAAAPANVCATSSTASYMRVEISSDSNSPIDYFELFDGSDGSTVKGLSMGHNSPFLAAGKGISISSDDNWIQCNHIGVNGPGDTELRINIGVCNSCTTRPADRSIIGTNADGVDDIAERNIIYSDFHGIDQNGGNDLIIAGNYFGLTSQGFELTRTTFECAFMRQNTRTLLGSNLDGFNDEIERNIFGKCRTGIRITLNLGFGTGNIIAGNWIGLNVNKDDVLNFNGVGVHITGSQEILFTENWVNASPTGLLIQQDVIMNPSSDNNCFTNNATTALEHQGTTVDLDLTNNYWGAVDGPSGVGAGSGGSIIETGTGMVGTVKYDPFLTLFPTDCYSTLPRLIFENGFEDVMPN